MLTHQPTRTDVVSEVIGIPGPDEDVSIQTRLYFPKGAKDLGTIVLVHGLGDSAWSDLVAEASVRLSEAGYRVMAPCLYGDQGDQRNLVDCTLATYERDLRRVVDHVRSHPGGGPVFGIGHSYGGLAILNSSLPLDRAVLWDASSPNVPGDFKSRFTGPIELPDGRQAYIQTYGRGLVIGREMVDEREALAATKGLDWSVKPYGTKFIAAGGGMLVESSREYFDNAAEPKGIDVIPGADHHFTDPNHRAKLIQSTLKWLAAVAR